MKRIEAQELALERSKLVIEYITQILSDSDKVIGNMRFEHAKIDGKNMCTLDIYVPTKNFEKHLNLGITVDHELVLFEQILNDFLDTFLDNETIGITNFYSIRSMLESFDGVDAVNLNESRIKIDFNNSNKNFMELVKKYQIRYDDFVNKQHKIESRKR